MCERVSDLMPCIISMANFRTLIDPTNTVSWRDWPNHADDSLAFSGTGPVEYSLQGLGELHEKA